MGEQGLCVDFGNSKMPSAAGGASLTRRETFDFVFFRRVAHPLRVWFTQGWVFHFLTLSSFISLHRGGTDWALGSVLDLWVEGGWPDTIICF